MGVIDETAGVMLDKLRETFKRSDAAIKGAQKRKNARQALKLYLKLKRKLEKGGLTDDEKTILEEFKQPAIDAMKSL